MKSPERARALRSDGDRQAAPCAAEYEMGVIECLWQ
jgi:hypothetical protein